MRIPKNYQNYIRKVVDVLKKEAKKFILGTYFNRFMTLFAVLGAYHFTKGLISVGSLSLRLLLRRRLDFLQRYGPNSYVLITGAATGIGKAFATRFVQMGFNLVIIDIDGSTLQATEKELFQIAPTAKILSLVIDLSQIEANISTILAATENLDISILINNAGLLRFGPFETINRTDMLLMTRVNVVAPLVLTREFIGRLRNRSKRSALINMSSFSGVNPPKYFAAYAATKAFLRFLSLCTEQENRDKIDILNATPGFVASNMTKLQPSWTTASIEECVDGILRDLGRRNETMGSWKQVIGEKLLGQKPNFVTDALLNSSYLELQDAARTAPKRF